MKKNTILIVGSGALATLFAARLVENKVQVTILDAWQEGVDALNQRGACLIDARGVKKCYPLRATSEASTCKGARNALVLVKSWQTEAVARQLGKRLAEDGVALTLQNGLGNGEKLARQLGKERVAQGVTTTGASLSEAGIAHIGGEGLVSVETHPRLGVITACLTEAGFNLSRVADVRSLIWRKLVINTAINPLTALLNIPNGDLLKIPSAKKMMGEIAEETAFVAKVQHIPLSFENPIWLAEDVCQQRVAFLNIRPWFISKAVMFVSTSGQQKLTNIVLKNLTIIATTVRRT